MCVCLFVVCVCVRVCDAYVHVCIWVWRAKMYVTQCGYGGERQPGVWDLTSDLGWDRVSVLPVVYAMLAGLYLQALACGFPFQHWCLLLCQCHPIVTPWWFLWSSSKSWVKLCKAFVLLSPTWVVQSIPLIFWKIWNELHWEKCGSGHCCYGHNSLPWGPLLSRQFWSFFFHFSTSKYFLINGYALYIMVGVLKRQFPSTLCHVPWLGVHQQMIILIDISEIQKGNALWFLSSVDSRLHVDIPHFLH